MALPKIIINNMHILLIHQAFAALNEPGGTRHHEFARLLVERGHRVTVIASPISYLTGKNAGAGEELEPGIRIIRSYTYAALHKSFLHRVLAFLSFMVSSFLTGLRVKEVDLVWGTSPPIFQGLTAWGLARLKRVPFLFEVRDLWPAFAIAVGVLKNPMLIRLSEWLERFLLSRADQVMVNSPGFLDHVKARGAAKVALVPNGADTRMFNPTAHGLVFRRMHGLGDKFIALYAGAHGMSNDLGVVLQAADLLRDRPDVKIVLLGDGKEKAALIEQASVMNLENVVFLPPVPKTEMADALAASSVCIGILKPVAMYATVYPNKIFDYLAAGRPIVLAMTGVIKEVVDAAEAGIAVPPGDPKALAAAIRTLYDVPDLQVDMGRSGRAYVEEHFDRERLAKKLVKLIEESGDPI